MANLLKTSADIGGTPEVLAPFPVAKGERLWTTEPDKQSLVASP